MRSLQFSLSRFGRDEDGSVAVEAVLILPMVFWAYLTLFSVFDTYRHTAVAQNATFTVADMVSRETTPLDDDYLNGARETMRYLANAQNSDTAIRVTSIQFDAASNTYEANWSQSRGWVTNLTTNDVSGWHSRLPVMPDDQHIIVVETWVIYKPPFNTGLGEQEISHFVFTKPRYAPNVCWTTCNPSS